VVRLNGSGGAGGGGGSSFDSNGDWIPGGPRVTDDGWKLKINVLTILQSLGIEVVNGSGAWRNCRCPFHEDKHPSFRSAIAPFEGAKGTSMPGHWHCFTCNLSGGIEQLYQRIKGGTLREARRALIEQFAPELLVAKRKNGAGKDARPLPSEPQIAGWCSLLKNNKEAMDYLLGRTLTPAVIEEAMLGWQAETIMLPVYTADRALANCKQHFFLAKHREEGRKKMYLWRGHGSGTAYPIWMLAQSKRRVVVEGEWDALCLHAIGEADAITTIGGAGSLTWANLSFHIPTGKGSHVYLCLDNDPEGMRSSIKLANECRVNGVEDVRLIPLPEGVKDINQYLMSLPNEAARKEAWESLLVSATSYGSVPSMTGGLVAAKGAYFAEAGNKVAPFTGYVTHSGILRMNVEDSEPERIFYCKLRHERGDDLTVRHRQRSKLIDSIMSTHGSGPSWMFAPRDQDSVLTAICGNSPFAEERDAGHMFGFGPTQQRNTYYSPSTIFNAGGPRPNNEIDPLPPTDFLAKFDLPQPDHEKFNESVRLVLDHFLKAHRVGVMLPLLATSLFAAVRRKEWPSEPRYTLSMYGASGCGKTSRAMLAQLMFSSVISQNEILSFESTLNFIGSTVSLAGDAVVLIDEAPFTRSNRAEIQAIERFLQGASQGTSRGRLDIGGAIQSVAIPSALLIITAEALPLEDEAMIARMLPLHVGNDLLLSPSMNDHLRETLRHAELLRHFMSTWVAWVMQGRIEMARLEMDQYSHDAERAFDARFPDWRTRLNGSRILSRVRVLTEVVVALGRFLRSMGNCGGVTADRLLEQWREEALPTLATEIGQSIDSTGAAVSIFDEAAAKLMSGAFSLSFQGLDEGRKWPKIAISTAHTVGMLKRGQVDGTSILWGGEHWSISISSSVAGRNIKRWGMMVQQLAQKGLAIQGRRKGSVTLTAEGARLLVDRMEQLLPP